MEIRDIKEIKGKGIQALAEFYTNLDEDKATSIDPIKVRVNEQWVKDFIDKAMEGEPEEDRLPLSLVVMNSGPGVDADVEYGKVKLLDGWAIYE